MTKLRKLHFKKGDKVTCRWWDRFLQGKVLFVSHKRGIAKVVIEKGQHPTASGTMAFYFGDVYKPL